MIVITHVNYRNFSALLTSGEITVGTCLTQELPANAKRKRFRTMRPMVVRADAAHTPLTLAEYCAVLMWWFHMSPISQALLMNGSRPLGTNATRCYLFRNTRHCLR